MRPMMPHVFPASPGHRSAVRWWVKAHFLRRTTSADLGRREKNQFHHVSPFETKHVNELFELFLETHFDMFETHHPMGSLLNLKIPKDT